MKLKLYLGIAESPRVVTWWKSDVTSFPNLVIYKNKKYQFIMYEEDDTKQVDYICRFSEMQSYDPGWSSYAFEDIGHMIDDFFGTKCECGSVHTFASQFHMFFCPLWKKV